MHPIQTNIGLIKTFRLFLIPALLATCLPLIPGPARATGIILNNESDTVAAGDTVSETTTGSTDARGAHLEVSSTLDNSGSISATSEAGIAYGASLSSSSTLDNRGSISATTESGDTCGAYLIDSTLDNSGSISATSEAGIAYGAYIYTSSTLDNRGSISATSESGYASGVEIYTSTLDNSGSISATTESGVAYAAYLNDSTLTNSGSISATSESGYALGVDIYNSTLDNSGSISATTESRVAYGAYAYNSTLDNSGSISATRTGSGTAYAIYALNSTVNLETGTQILSGSVYSSSSSTLNITSASDLDFELAGSWRDITHSGSGTWTMALASNSSLDVTGTATLDGTLLVDVSPSALSTTVLTAGTLNTGADYSASASSTNPNFTVTGITTTTGANGSVSVTASFTPQDDASSLASTVALSSAQAFAGVAQVRSLTLLADSGQSEKEPILVAANGSMAGMLNPKAPDAQWSMFLQPVFSLASRDGDANSVGYDAVMAGMEAGIDRRFGDNWVLGAMAGIGTAIINFNGSDFVDSDSEDQALYTAGVYGGYRLDDWVFSDTLSVTYVTHGSDRNAGLGQTATADYDSWLTANQFLAVYEWHPSEQWEIAPRAGLNVSWLHRDGFAEENATNAVSFDDLDKVFADAVLGVRVTHEGIQAEQTLITPYVGAGLIHSLGNGDITVRQYLSTTSAQVTTENDSDRLTTECGVTFGFGPTSLTVAYDGEYGENTDAHTLFGTLRWTF